MPDEHSISREMEGVKPEPPAWKIRAGARLAEADRLPGRKCRPPYVLPEKV